MAPKKRKISSLIESQLPGFINNEYQNFSKFIEKYYEQQSSVGQPIDIITNLEKYADIDTYEKNLLSQSTTLAASVTADQSSITLSNASSFPKENGYIKIGEEILFYQTREGNTLTEVSRGVSGNTTLGDLYHSSRFVTTAAAAHGVGSTVHNISNLFLYALVKEFEKTYLSSFPEAYLKEDVDKRLLIKNISKFYKAKGTDRSVKFIFNSIISKEPDNVPEILNPKDYTLKASTSGWEQDNTLKCISVSGNIQNLVGNIITQESETNFASAAVDFVRSIKSDGIDNYYEIGIDSTTLNGTFEIASRTALLDNIVNTDFTGDRITVKSTEGFPSSGRLLIRDEEFVYSSKTVNQFIISDRIGPRRNHSVGDRVYSYNPITTNGATIILFGAVYGLSSTSPQPYATVGDLINVSDPGFITRDPVIHDIYNSDYTFGTPTDPEYVFKNRWFLNESPSTAKPVVRGVVKDFVGDVSAIYEDDQYYYICSSGWPVGSSLSGATVNYTPEDQRNLKLIRKHPVATTEVYKTSTRDVGVLLDGVPVISYKDDKTEKFGSIVSTTITNKGSGYEAPPFVLINEVPNKATAVLSGNVVDRIIIGTNEAFTDDPTIRITSGEGAKLSPVVTNGAITSIDVVEPGKYYSSPPKIVIVDNLGKGAFAEFEAVLDANGGIESCTKISGGRFYTRGYINVSVTPAGRAAAATCKIKEWTYDRYQLNKNQLDSDNGTFFPSYNNLRGYGYGYVANPVSVRTRAYPDASFYGQNAQEFPNTPLRHSPIIGFAYDGNPIYGPYGYTDPLGTVSFLSDVSRMRSGYQLKANRVGGPDTDLFPMGTFIEDYEWVPSINSGKTELDQNNGRFCVTPEYPEGTYAYFVTVSDSGLNQTPEFPYIIGDNFYSLPVDSNYNSPISQSDLPVGVKSVRSSLSETNGVGFVGSIDSIRRGNITSSMVEESREYHSPGCDVVIDETGTGGELAIAKVNEVSGRSVVSLESTETPATYIKILETAYLFAGDRITMFEDEVQIADGELIGDVINDTTLVVRNVGGKFKTNLTFDSETLVLNLFLDRDSTFTQGSTLTLTNDDDDVIASGIILESTSRQNSVKVKVETGAFSTIQDYYLRSTNLSDTNRAEIISLQSLSTGLTIFDINDNIAIVETADNHGLSIGDKATVNIIPDDADSTTTYYVRKRLYQSATTLQPTHTSEITDVGIGSGDIINSGEQYTVGTYEDVELIFQDQTLVRNNLGYVGAPYNARATLVVSSPFNFSNAGVTEAIVTTKGYGYRTGDILTVLDSSLLRTPEATSPQRFTLRVDWVGFAKGNSVLYLSNVTNISQDDYLQIEEEVVQVSSVNVTDKAVTVTRAAQGTVEANHYNTTEVTLKDGFYRFDDGFKPFGDGIGKPTLLEYSTETGEIFVGFDYSAPTPQKLSNSSSFFDSSVPGKQVTFRTVTDAGNRLEFSTDNTSFDINPIIDIQKYYRYTFDISHISMVGTYLDFSSSANYNVFTEEKTTSGIAPGNAGAFVSIKLGFGPAIAGNDYQEQVPVNFQNYFYFIRAEDVDTSGSYLRIVDDPLTGVKDVIYITDTRFVYNLDQIPAYDGTGSISYITPASKAVGNIVSLSLVNSGVNYTSLPIVRGVEVDVANRADVVLDYNSSGGNILGATVVNGGSNYSKPIAVVDGEGSGAVIEVLSKFGVVDGLNVIDGGNYTSPPSVRIVESDLKIYFGSNNIGLPKGVSIQSPGSGYHGDTSQIPSYKSATSFLLKEIDGPFYSGEVVVQPISDLKQFNYSTVQTVTATVASYREGSNLLKVTGIKGVFKEGQKILSRDGRRSAVLVAQITTEYDVDYRPYIDNFGFFNSDRGKLSEATQKLTDSFFYQDYSYIIKSKSSIDIWRDLIKQTVHPAGFKMFGEMVIDATALPAIPQQKLVSSHNTVIEAKVQGIRSLLPEEFEGAPRQRVVVSQQKLQTLIVEEGRGSVSVDTFDTSETQSNYIELSPAFDGRFDPVTGQLTGTTTFTLIDRVRQVPVNLRKEEELFVTLDGIWQEPGVSYTVSGTQIEFAKPPLGYRLVEGQDVDPVKFYGRSIKFKNDDLSARYAKKVKDISPEFDGVKFEFDLYWEDGTIVKSDEYENFIVTLNGVVQKARQNAREPFSNAYYIRRSEDENVTDVIVFSKPPIDNDDLYDEERIPEILKNYEFCSIITVGSYERLTIDTEIYEYRGAGPYLLLDEITRDVRKVDDPSYALVFIDGVLQRDTESYQIVGPNIEFAEPLSFYIDETGRRVTQDVNVILVYGRDVPRTLTFYDYEIAQFLNLIEVTLTGTGINAEFAAVYETMTRLAGAKWHVAQDGKPMGNLLEAELGGGPDTVVLTLTNERNVVIDPDLPLYFQVTFAYEYLPSYQFPINGTYSIAYNYKTDDNGERIVQKRTAPQFYGYKQAEDVWNNRNSLIGNLIEGDRILIDGERDFRTITGTTMEAKVKSFNDGDLVQNNLYSQIDVTDYNGYTEGVGLSMTAAVDQFGQVTSLNVAALEWNQRDLLIYLNGGPLLQPTAYGYYETPVIHFIPVDGNGGGAEAEVIAYGGQILDVVLTKQGSGYTQPPRVVVARRYKRIKENSRKIDSFTYLRAQPKLNVRIEQPNIVTEIIITGAGAQSKFFSIASFGSFTGTADPNTSDKRKIIEHVMPDPDKNQKPIALEMIQTSEDDLKIIGNPDINIESFSTTIEKQVTLFNGGLTSHVTEINFAKQSQIDEKVHREITSHIHIDFKDIINKYDVNRTSGLGTFLDAPVDLDDTILLVGNTSGFPDTADRLRVNGELFFYQKRLPDRFLNVIRGYQGSPIQSHNAGDLVVHEQEYITAISAGVTVIESLVEDIQAFETTIESHSVVQVQTGNEEGIQPQFPYDYDHYELWFQTQNVSEESIGTTLQPDSHITVIAVPQAEIVTSFHFTQSEVSTASATQYKVFPVYSNENARVRPDVEKQIREEVQLAVAPKVNQIISEIPVAIPSASLSTNILTLSHQETKAFTQQQLVRSASITHSQIVENIKSTLDPRHSTSDVLILNTKLVDAKPENIRDSTVVVEAFNMVSHSTVELDVSGLEIKSIPSIAILENEEYIEVTQVDQISVNAGDRFLTILQATLDVPDHEMKFATSKIIGRPVYYKQPAILRVEGPVDDSHDVKHVQTVTTASIDIKIASSSKLSPNMNRQITNSQSITRRVY